MQAIELLCSFAPIGLAEVLVEKGEEFVASEVFVKGKQAMWDRIIFTFVSDPESVWYPYFQQGHFQTMEIRYYSKQDWSKLSIELQEKVLSLSLNPKLIPSGSFQMGIGDKTMARAGYRSERPHHTVQLTQPFLMNAYPCTTALFASVMGSSQNGGALTPVVNVSWVEAISFCNTLSLLHGKKAAYGIPSALQAHLGNPSGRNHSLSAAEQASLIQEITFDAAASGYRLPTEAQWEYVAKYGWSDVVPQDGLQNWAWYSFNTRKIQCVGQKNSNDLGVCDMLGLVWEWVADTYRTDAYTEEKRVDPLIQDSSSHRVIRGGSYLERANAVRASIRNAKPVSFQADNIGFRWVCPADSQT